MFLKRGKLCLFCVWFCLAVVGNVTLYSSVILYKSSGAMPLTMSSGAVSSGAIPLTVSSGAVSSGAVSSGAVSSGAGAVPLTVLGLVKSTTMQFHEMMTNMLPYLTSASIALIVWLVKRSYTFEAWKLHIGTEDLPNRLKVVENWKISHEASQTPALQQMPILMAQLERHSATLHQLRNTQLKAREANQTKLDIVLSKLDSIEQNCAVHKLSISLGGSADNVSVGPTME